MSLLLTLTTKHGTPRQPADADTTPSLANEAGTAGVIRNDTQAVVVAAGTLFTRVGVGQYVYELTDVVAGVTYTAYRRVTLGNITQTLAKLYTVSPVALLPSFLTLAEAEQLAAALPGLASFKAAGSVERQQYLAAATDRVATSRPWQGCKVDPKQVLPFPRYRGRPFPFQLATAAGSADVWDLDPATRTPVVPLDVRKATIYEADSLADGERQRIQNAIHNGLLAATTGSLSESYRTDGKGLPVLCEAADLLLRQYLRRSAVLT